MTLDTATIAHLPLEDIDTSLSSLRLNRPVELDKMRRSLERLGQLHPVLVRVDENTHELLDGFKRYYGAEHLGWSTLQAIIVEMPIIRGKALMLSYNRKTRSLLDYDEALILHNLKVEHLLDQVAISRLTGYSRSWVCRRLALVEKLCEQARQALRMGSISNSQARSIVKLPRGNQAEIMQLIITHHITSKDAGVLVERYLSSTSADQQQYILSNPLQAIAQSRKKQEIYDARLTHHGNRLLKTMELLMIQQHIFISQMSHPLTGKLTQTEKDLLDPKLDRLEKIAQKTVSVFKNTMPV